MTDSRLAELEAQHLALGAEIAKLRAERPTAPPPPPRDEVRIVEVLNERSDLPDLKQMTRLFNIVKQHSPWPQTLVDRFDETRPFRAFCAAFRWVMNTQRLDRPNGRVALSYWADTCRMWLRARNSVGSDVDANSIILACLAAGDVAYSPADPTRGWVWELGLIEFGGRPANTDAWRAVLNGRAILAPSQPARRTAPPSLVRVVVGY
jgi:hypothetical protein